MRLFGRREVEPPGLVIQVAELRSLLENLSSEVRTLRAELAIQSDLVTKRMRRAIAAERAVERNQELREGVPVAPPARAETPAPPARRLSMWGARARIATRAARALAESVPAINGSGDEHLAEVEE